MPSLMKSMKFYSDITNSKIHQKLILTTLSFIKLKKHNKNLLFLLNVRNKLSTLDQKRVRLDIKRGILVISLEL